MTHPRRRPRTAAAALAVTALATTAAVPAVASAATGGATTIELGGAVARSLRAQDVRLSARKPAKANQRRIVLPVAGGTTSTLDHRGAVSFRARVARRTRTATFTGWQTKLSARRATISAKLGRRRVALFTVTYRPVARTNAGDKVTLTASTARLTPKGARAVRRALALSSLPAGVLGKAKVNATVETNDGGTRPTTPTPGGGGNSGGGGTGGGGGGTTPPPTQPEVRPIDREPPVLARPASAVDVTRATITWWVRDSFIRYVWGGGDTTFSNGVVGGDRIDESAHACGDNPAGGGIPPLSYSFTFPFSRGWWDAASGTAGIYGTGSVTFSYPSHGIDLTANDPEIELTGSSARAIMRFNGSGATNPGNRRGVLVTLANSGPAPVPGGPLVTLRGTLPTTAAGETDVFAGFYPRGSPFGCFQVDFATS